MKKVNANVSGIDEFEHLVTLDKNWEEYAYNVTNVFSVMKHAGFEPRPGSTIEISFREIAGPAEPGTKQKEK